jgi:hypothetical protein
MKFKWLVIAVAAVCVPALGVPVFGVIAADPALARVKHKAKPACVDRPFEFSWGNLFSSRPAPQPNGCAPPVHQYGRFIGQDPDRNIRLQLKRDPATGYAPL